MNESFYGLLLYFIQDIAYYVYYQPTYLGI